MTSLFRIETIAIGALAFVACDLVSGEGRAAPCAENVYCSEPPARDEGPVDPQGYVAVDATYHEHSYLHQNETVVTIVVRSSFRERNVTFEPEMPLFYDRPDAVGGTFLLGNPTFGVQYHFFDRESELRLGGGATLPMATLEGADGGHGSAYLLAAGSWGFWHVWRFYPDAASIFAPMGFRLVRGWLDVGGEAAAALVFPVRSDQNRQPLLGIEGGVYAAYLAPPFEAGLRVRGVRLPGNGARDPYQTSLEPYGELLFGPVFFGLGLVTNVDPPLGRFFESNAVWAIRVETGSRF